MGSSVAVVALWPCWWPLHYRPPHGPISARTGVLLNEGVPIMEEWRRGVVLCAVAEERELFPKEWRGLAEKLIYVWNSQIFLQTVHCC